MSSSLAAFSFTDLLPNSEPSSLERLLSKVESLAAERVRSIDKGPSVVAYSAGVDSSILAELARRCSGSVTLLSLGRAESSDLRAVSKDALLSRPGFNPFTIRVDLEEVKSAAVSVSSLVRVDNLSHFEDCVAFWLSARAAKKFGDIRYIVSANGPDELFCGYDRFRRIVDQDGYGRIQGEIQTALASAFALRKQVALVVSEFDCITQEPFLHEEFCKMALTIPSEFKILKGNDLLRKRVWRCLARILCIPEATVTRHKKAMQYGMGIHPVVLSMLKHGKIAIKSE